MYTGPVGSANLGEQIHDYNVHIDINDVFWMVPVANESVDVAFDQGQASVRVNGLRVFDDHDLANSLTLGLGLPGGLGFSYPKIAPAAPANATVSFDIEWGSPSTVAEIRNDSQHFRGSFQKSVATIQWSVEQAGFQFESEPPNPARNVVSVLGYEQNGIFFDLASS